MAERIRGNVKWFSNQRGYGFVAPEQGGSDIFIHFSNVQMSGYKTLREGQLVEFEVGTIDKGGKTMSNALEVVILPDQQADQQVDLPVDEPDEEDD